jgi:hypothetical protein
MPFDRLKDFNAGQMLTAPMLNQFKQVIKRTIAGGGGIEITELGNQVLISLSPYSGGTGGAGTGSDFIIYEADTKAELPEIDGPALGYVATGSDIGYYGRIGDASTGTWVNFTHYDTV